MDAFTASKSSCCSRVGMGSTGQLGGARATRMDLVRMTSKRRLLQSSTCAPAPPYGLRRHPHEHGHKQANADHEYRNRAGHVSTRPL